ncbi:MAG: hypothetical protein K2I17_01625, partial [Clostridia bacterium]|nr:hypothetical protein [Clostridia bacterium]
GGQALLRSKQGVKRALLYILTPIFCAGLCLGTVFSFSKTNANAEDAPVKQSTAYLDLNGSGKILNGFEGAQNEYIYFGTYNDSDVKWRVLSKDGSNYGSGMLLWADIPIATEAYNSYNDKPDYAYWGTSKIRAVLNGGTYYSGSSATTPTSIAPAESLYNKLFSDIERKAVEESGSYTTDNYATNINSSDKLFYKEKITATTDSTAKYNINRISSSYPTSQYAFYDATDGTVREMTSGDNLFLLDYYDINNVDYGFSDGGQTYANNVSASWKPSSNWFPSNNDNSTSTVSNYLKFSGESYWLRNAGRRNASDSTALYVQSSGYVDLGGPPINKKKNP